MVRALTTAQVTLITEEGTPKEKIETVAVPMRAVGELKLINGFIIRNQAYHLPIVRCIYLGHRKVKSLARSKTDGCLVSTSGFFWRI